MASREKAASQASAPVANSSPGRLPVPRPVVRAAPATMTPAAAATRADGRRRPADPVSTGPAIARATGTAPTTVPTMAGLAARVASMTHTLKPTMPTAASAASSSSYDHHLRRMRRRYRARRDALVNALNRWLPTARVRGVSAGLHLLLELPPGCAEADAAAAAA